MIPTSMSCRRRCPRALALIAATAFVAGPLAIAADASSTPARDTFSGQITKATGTFKGDRGRLTILLHVAQSTDAARKLQAAVVGASCGTAKHCLRLSGTLTGTISARPSTIPDAGRRWDLKLSGRLNPLGTVSSSGLVAGVGFIRHGHEGLTLTLRTNRGSITLGAVSPLVPGFTGP